MESLTVNMMQNERKEMLQFLKQKSISKAITCMNTPFSIYFTYVAQV